MATDQRTINSAFSTDADFRAWGVALAAQFAAVGLVKTADTGQIDWTTILSRSRPTSSAAMRSGASTMRFKPRSRSFIRIDYGSGSNALNPSLWVTVGTATNGAGTLTGQVGVQRQVLSSTGATASYCSGSSSR
jgi:hypothetical protein